jgi:hypothetical protein
VLHHWWQTSASRAKALRIFQRCEDAYADALPALQRQAEHKIFTRLAGDIPEQGSDIT